MPSNSQPDQWPDCTQVDTKVEQVGQFTLILMEPLDKEKGWLPVDLYGPFDATCIGPYEDYLNIPQGNNPSVCPACTALQSQNLLRLSLSKELQFPNRFRKQFCMLANFPSSRSSL